MFVGDAAGLLTIHMMIIILQASSEEGARMSKLEGCCSDGRELWDRPSCSQESVVSPGPIDTPGLQGLAGTNSDGLSATFRDRVPLGRVGRPDDIASAVSFLASSDASFITGAELFVDGGLAQI
jgi:hypothetical protein